VFARLVPLTQVLGQPSFLGCIDLNSVWELLFAFDSFFLCFIYFYFLGMYIQRLSEEASVNQKQLFVQIKNYLLLTNWSSHRLVKLA